ncbi:acyl-CoA thioesterase YciA [Roseomonas pecuniae]|uniref:Acyl-CoA thioesterase YciA n=2 Tax=Muricoccus pecuniae TaxID=693023 RepID=A0A840XU66_9PROT|nr:acyl-CoA thioesterase YciA [Roseomonas pecuniae]
MTDKPPDIPGGAQLRTIAMPRDTNAGGSIFGGWTLSQMDLAGGTLAGERAAGRVVTVSIDAMRFLRPVSVGDEVSCYCVIEKAGDTSIAVKIETWARPRGGKPAEKVTEGLFTYVAIDEDGHPRELPEAGEG